MRGLDARRDNFRLLKAMDYQVAVLTAGSDVAAHGSTSTLHCCVRERSCSKTCGSCCSDIVSVTIKRGSTCPADITSATSRNCLREVPTANWSFTSFNMALAGIQLSRWVHIPSTVTEPRGLTSATHCAMAPGTPAH